MPSTARRSLRNPPSPPTAPNPPAPPRSSPPSRPTTSPSPTSPSATSAGRCSTAPPRRVSAAPSAAAPSGPPDAESAAHFPLRHFGREVLDRVAAPLLSGVFGGDVRRLSVRAVLPAFVQMERTHGSLIAALQRTTNIEPRSTPVFTTLRTGLGTLVDRLVPAIPQPWLRTNTA